MKCPSHTIEEAKKVARLPVTSKIPTNTKLQVPLEDAALWQSLLLLKGQDAPAFWSAANLSAAVLLHFKTRSWSLLPPPDGVKEIK